MDQVFTLKGRRINLRTTTEADVSDYERWNSQDLEAWKYDGPWFDDDLSGTIRLRRRWLEGTRKPPYPFLEIESKDGVHLGWVNVYYKKNDPHMSEVGIDITEESYWGKGLGTEALSLWIDHLFQTSGFSRIGFSTWEGNRAMIRVGEKLGFSPESRIRKGCEVNGVFYDRIKMGLLRSEWEIRQKRLQAKPKASDLRIREAEPKDRSEWLRMREALWPDHPDDHPKEIDEYFGNPERKGITIVAELQDGSLGGFLEAGVRDCADGCLTRNVGYIEGWYVDPGLRGLGVGRRLVQEAEAWALRRGCREMGSDCILSNERSYEAHLALGYTETERLIHFRKVLAHRRE